MQKKCVAPYKTKLTIRVRIGPLIKTKSPYLIAPQYFYSNTTSLPKKQQVFENTRSLFSFSLPPPSSPTILRPHLSMVHIPKTGGSFLAKIVEDLQIGIHWAGYLSQIFMKPYFRDLEKSPLVNGAHFSFK